MSPIALRACLLASAAAGLTACASNPPGREGPAPIDFRNAAPRAEAAPAPIVAEIPRAVAPAAVAPAPASRPEEFKRVVDVGSSPTGTSAIEEAKSMSPEAGYRPGGTLRQARDNPSARAIEVQSGDTLYDISRRYSVNMRALIETNGMEPPYALDKGDVVYLPPPNVHVVEKGETLYSVSRRYNVDTRSLALLNNMQRPWTVYVGDELQLPPLAREQAREVVKAAPVAPPVVKAPVAKPIDDKAISLVGDKTTAPVKAAPKPVVEPPAPPKSTPATPAGARDFIWPISGNVLKGFGAGADGIRNDGVNIAAAPGSDVRAAAGGEVVYAGSELAGFGNLVLIRHPGGWVTAYAHSDVLKVKEGDLVKQGQAIATAGQSGNASSPQVHFELRKGKEPVDPALHLPELRG
ncbi:MAG TPA: M23 family metallopeptidase [Hyphomonadaceae bacterium]|nr:M23 family metallopeptidase [Hyphomonadaceae bacterium]